MVEYKAWMGSRKMGRQQYVESLPSTKPAAVGGGGRLFEFWTGGSHPSRGGPEAFTYNLNQSQLNVLVSAALTGDNGALKTAMAGERLLAKIPTN